VVIVLNDNGRSYAPTVSRLSSSVTRLRLNPSYVRNRERFERALDGVPLVGDYLRAAAQGLRAAAREVFEAKNFFEALGVRYVGPLDGHDVPLLESALSQAAEHDGPIVVHVLTQKGRGYLFAEEDEEKCLHDVPIFDPALGPPDGWARPKGYTEAFSHALIAAAERDPAVVAITAAMPGPTGLLPFQERFPHRFVDVGIAEQHAVTAAAGMAMGGLRPVVAVYSTFFTRAMDQANLDVGLHGLPVVFALDRAGITGDDGPSHHGVLDLALLLRIPAMTIFAPSSAQEVGVMMEQALAITSGPSAIRYPKTPARQAAPDQVGHGLDARRVRAGADVCILAVGKMLESAEDAALLLDEQGIDATVWDVRVVRPLDQAMLADAASHPLVVTVEDGIRVGGAGSSIADAIAELSEGRTSPPVLILGIPERYVPQGKPAQILSDLGLDGPGVAAAVSRTLGVRGLLSR
jgi:1-deoxy-D-xylulose-5-phosphate synthase